MSKRDGNRKGIRPVTMDEYLAERGINFGRACLQPKSSPHDLHSERIPGFNSDYLFLFHKKRKNQPNQQEVTILHPPSQRQISQQEFQKEVKRRSQRNSHQSSDLQHLEHELTKRQLQKDLLKSEKEKARLLEQVKMMAQAMQQMEGENRGISALNLQLEDRLKNASNEFQKQKEKEIFLQQELEKERVKNETLENLTNQKDEDQNELTKVIELNRNMADELDRVEELLEDRDTEISELKQKLEENPKPQNQQMCQFCVAANDPCLSSSILDHVKAEKCTCDHISNSQIEQINLLPESILLPPPNTRNEIKTNRSGEEAVQRLKLRIEELEDEMARLSGKKKKLQDSLFRERDNVGLIKLEAESMAVENNRLEHESNDLKKIIRQLEEREAEQCKTHKKTKEELASFMDINTSREHQIRKLEENITFLEPQIEEIQTTKQIIFEENQDLQTQIEKLNKQIEERKNQALVLEERLWKSDKNCQNLIMQNEKLAGNLNQQLEEVKRLEGGDQDHQKQLLTARVGRFLLSMEIERRTREINDFIAREKSLKIQLEHQKEETQNVSQETQRLNQELKETHQNLKLLKKLREQESEEHEKQKKSLKSIPPTSCYNSSKHFRKNENRHSLNSIPDSKNSQTFNKPKDSSNLATDLLMQRLEQLNGDFKRLEEKVTSEIIGRQRLRDSVDRQSCSRRSRTSSRLPITNRQISRFEDSHQKSVNLSSSNSKCVYNQGMSNLNANLDPKHVGNQNGAFEDSVVQIQRQLGMIGQIKSQNHCKTEACNCQSQIDYLIQEMPQDSMILNSMIPISCRSKQTHQTNILNSYSKNPTLMMSPDEIDYSDICLQRDNPPSNHFQNQQPNSKVLSTPSSAFFNKDSRLINNFRPSQEPNINRFSAKASSQNCSPQQQELLLRLHAQALLSQRNTNHSIQSPNATPLNHAVRCHTADFNQGWKPQSQVNSRKSPQNTCNGPSQSNMFRNQFPNRKSPENSKGNVFVTASWPKSQQKEDQRKIPNRMQPLPEEVMQAPEAICNQNLMNQPHNLSAFQIQNQDQIQNNKFNEMGFQNEIEIQKTETSKMMHADSEAQSLIMMHQSMENDILKQAKKQSKFQNHSCFNIDLRKLNKKDLLNQTSKIPGAKFRFDHTNNPHSKTSKSFQVEKSNISQATRQDHIKNSNINIRRGTWAQGANILLQMNADQWKHKNKSQVQVLNTRSPNHNRFIKVQNRNQNPSPSNFPGGHLNQTQNPNEKASFNIHDPIIKKKRQHVAKSRSPKPQTMQPTQTPQPAERDDHTKNPKLQNGIQKSKLKDVLLRQRSKCHSTQRHKTKGKLPPKLGFSRARGRSFGSERITKKTPQLRNLNLGSGQNTPNWGMSQRSWQVDSSQKNSKLKKCPQNKNFFSRKRYSEQGSFRKKKENNLKHRIRVNMKDENTILSKPSLLADRVDASIKTHKGISKIDLTMDINGLYKQKIRKEESIPRNDYGINRPNSQANTQHSIKNSSRESSLNKERPKTPHTHLEQQFDHRSSKTEISKITHHGPNHLSNAPQSKALSQNSDLDVSPMRKIKSVRSQREIEKEHQTHQETIVSENVSTNREIHNQYLLQAEEEDFVKVVRVKYNGNDMDISQMPRDGKIKKYLREIGYNSYEDNGKRGLRRKSHSRPSASSKHISTNMSQISANRSRKFSENHSYIIPNSEQDLQKKNRHLDTPLLNRTPARTISNKSIQNSQISIRSSSCTNTAKKKRNSSSRINNRGVSEEAIKLPQFYGTSTPTRTNLNMKQTFKSKESDYGRQINFTDQPNWMDQIPGENASTHTDTRNQNQLLAIENSEHKEPRGRSQLRSKEYINESNRRKTPVRNRYSQNNHNFKNLSRSQTPNKHNISQNTSYVQIKNYSSISNPAQVHHSQPPLEDNSYIVSKQSHPIHQRVPGFRPNVQSTQNHKNPKAGGKESMALWKNVSSPYQSEKLTEKRYNAQHNTQFEYGPNLPNPNPNPNQQPKLNSLQCQLNTPPPDSLKHIRSKNVFVDSRESPNGTVNSSQSRHIFLQNSGPPSKQALESMDTFHMSLNVNVNGPDQPPNNSSLTHNNYPGLRTESHAQINERKLKNILEPHNENYPVVRKRKNTIDKQKENSSRQLFVKSKSNFQNLNRNSFGLIETTNRFEPSSRPDNQI